MFCYFAAGTIVGGARKEKESFDKKRLVCYKLYIMW